MKNETYTTEEIKRWFEIMKNRYPNSVTYTHLRSVEFMMFDEDSWKKDRLENIKNTSAL